MPVVSDAKHRIVDLLKRVDSATAQELADRLATTATAVRQHLDALERAGLVERLEGPVAGRGRPAIRWRTTSLSSELFPDHHAQLTVELIGSIRDALGQEALDRVIDQRAEEQLISYRHMLDGLDVPQRVRALAQRRSQEGYVAEVIDDGDDWILVEHHCPICAAATACQGLCRSELEVFRSTLGESVTVTREQHVLGGDARCAYRIERR